MGTDAIGAEQLPQGALRVGPLDGNFGPTGHLDPRSEVDVRNLTKAADIGQEIAKRTAVLRSALSDGAPEAKVIDGEAFVRPAVGRLTSVFGARWGVTHYGVDIANAIGTPIYALTDGVVTESGPASGFGMWVVVRHPDGERTVYGHVIGQLRRGQPVRAGEQRNRQPRLHRSRTCTSRCGAAGRHQDRSRGGGRRRSPAGLTVRAYR